MTSPFLAEGNKLKNIQLNLEKNELLLLEHIAKYLDARVLEYYKDLEIARNTEIEALRNEIRNLFVLSNNIKQTVNGQLDCIDFKQLKRNMELMQVGTGELKQRTTANLDELRKNEAELCREMRAYELRMQDWGRCSSLTPNFPRESETNKNKKVDQRVADFLTFIAKSGGHENGWNLEDHNLFLKIKTKCRSEQEVAQHLHAILPDISEEEVIAHDRWYAQYLELKAKHREAIKKWRLSKSAPKIQVEKQETQKRPVTSISVENLSRKEVKERVKAWKEEKTQKLRSEREMKWQEELLKRRSEERRKQKYEQLKETVQNWRCANAEKKQTEELEKLMTDQKIREFKSAMANRLIKEFQSQDELFMKRKENLKPKMKAEAKCNSERVKAPRDPSRLLKPTKQWILRTNDDENDEKIKSLCSIKHIPKLGVPEWRRQLLL